MHVLHILWIKNIVVYCERILEIKYLEKFRPLAPAIINKFTKDFFEFEYNSPFMEKALKIKTSKRKLIPSVTHIDGTGRLQTVSRKTNKKFYDLIFRFYRKNTCYTDSKG